MAKLPESNSIGKFIQDEDFIIDAFLGISFKYSKLSCSNEQRQWIQYLNRYLLGQGEEESKTLEISNKITIKQIESIDQSQKIIR